MSDHHETLSILYLQLLVAQLANINLILHIFSILVYFLRTSSLLKLSPFSIYGASGQLQ